MLLLSQGHQSLTKFEISLAIKMGVNCEVKRDPVRTALEPRRTSRGLIQPTLVHTLQVQLGPTSSHSLTISRMLDNLEFGIMISDDVERFFARLMSLYCFHLIHSREHLFISILPLTLETVNYEAYSSIALLGISCCFVDHSPGRSIRRVHDFVSNGRYA